MVVYKWRRGCWIAHRFPPPGRGGGGGVINGCLGSSGPSLRWWAAGESWRVCTRNKRTAIKSACRPHRHETFGAKKPFAPVLLTISTKITAANSTACLYVPSRLGGGDSFALSTLFSEKISEWEPKTEEQSLCGRNSQWYAAVAGLTDLASEAAFSFTASSAAIFAATASSACFFTWQGSHREREESVDVPDVAIVVVILVAAPAAAAVAEFQVRTPTKTQEKPLEPIHLRPHLSNHKKQSDQWPRPQICTEDNPHTQNWKAYTCCCREGHAMFGRNVVGRTGGTR